MKNYTRRGVIETFFYLASSDGEISPAEQAKLDEIGWVIDPEHYESFRVNLLTEVFRQMGSGYEPEDQYDVIAEGVDHALALTPEDETDQVPSRLLVWDLLVIAFSDGEYEENERRLVKHVARVSGVEKSVFLQMEQMIRACETVDRELMTLTASDSASNVEKLRADELKHRHRVVFLEANALIADELCERKIEVLTYKPDVFDKAKEAVSEAVAPVAKKVAPVTSAIGEQAGKLVEDTKEKLGKVTGPVKSGISKETEKLVGLFARKKNSKEGR